MPITFKARQDGTSSIDIVTIVKTGWKSLGSSQGSKKICECEENVNPFGNCFKRDF